MWVIGAEGAVLGVITAGVTALLLHRYFGTSLADTVSTAGLCTAFDLLLLLPGLLWSREQIRTMWAWTAGVRDGDHAERTWAAIVRHWQITVRCAVPLLCGTPVLAVYIKLRFHQPWWALMPLTLGALLALGSAMVAIVFAADVLLRPIRRDVASFLGSTFEPKALRIPLRAKLIAPLPLITMFGTILVGAYSNASSSGLERFTIALVAAVTSVGVATAIFVAILGSILRPIDDLVAVTRRVRDGHFDTPVSVLSTDELGELARAFNEMLGALSERERLRLLYTEMLEASDETVLAVERERDRAQRDIHDGAQRDLLVLNRKLREAIRLTDSNPAAATGQLAELRETLGRTLRDVSDFAAGFFPDELEQDGLSGALVVAAKTAGAQLECGSVGRYGVDIERAVYMCCNEAIQNVLKHAGEGASVRIRIADDGRQLQFSVIDDGCGHNPMHSDGRGVRNMRDRMRGVGGRLEIQSSHGSGTRVIGVIPILR
jgi:signal transduction histidine kinase